MNRKVPMNYNYRNHDNDVALRLVMANPGLQELKREYHKVFEGFSSGNEVSTALLLTLEKSVPRYSPSGV